jgi:hypothetical protein
VSEHAPGTTCPICEYDLASLMNGQFVRCPECGRRWSVQWMLENHELPPPPKGWLLLPLILAIPGSIVGTMSFGAAAVLVGIGTYFCWVIAAEKTARPRHGDFALVVALILPALPAFIWALFCAGLGGMLRLFL